MAEENDKTLSEEQAKAEVEKLNKRYKDIMERAKKGKRTAPNVEKKGDDRIKQMNYYVKIIGIVLFVIGILGVLLYFVTNPLAKVSDFGLALLFLGGFGFVPVGFIFGILLCSPYKRAWMLRKLSRGANYGVVHFVGHGRNILTVIKNLNYDTIWLNDEVFIVEPNRIYRMNDEDHAEPIKPKHVFYESGVPVIFFDIDNYLPMTFYGEDLKIKSQQVGSSLKAWVITEEAKALAWKKMQQITTLVMIVLLLANAYLSWQTNAMMYAMTKNDIPQIKTDLGKLTGTVAVPTGQNMTGGQVINQVR